MSYISDLIKRGFFELLDNGATKAEIAEKTGVKNSLYYELRKLHPFYQVLAEKNLGLAQCRALAREVSALLKQHDIDALSEAIKSLSFEGDILEELSSKLEQSSIYDDIFKQYFEVVIYDGKVLPIWHKPNVESTRDIQLLALAVWQVSISTETKLLNVLANIKNVDEGFYHQVKSESITDFMLNIIKLIWRKERDLSTVFRATELLITRNTQFREYGLDLLIRGYI